MCFEILRFTAAHLWNVTTYLVLYVVVLCLLKKIMGRKEEGNAPPCTKIILRQRHTMECHQDYLPDYKHCCKSYKEKKVEI